MISRFRISIFSPKDITGYIKDKIGMVFLYVILLGLFCSIGTIFKLGMYNGLNYQNKNELSELIYVNQTKIPNVKITNFQMEPSDEKIIILYQEAVIAINTDLSLDTISIYGFACKEFGVDIYYLGIKMHTLTYHEMGLDNLDFGLIGNGNEAEFSKLINIINLNINHYKVIWLSVIAGFTFASLVINHLILSIFLGFILAYLYQIKYFKVLKITIYGITVMQVSLLLSDLFNVNLNLFGMEIISFIGVIISVIIINKAIKQLLLTSISK